MRPCPKTGVSSHASAYAKWYECICQISKQSSSSPASILPIWGRSVRRLTPAPCALISSIHIWCGIPLITVAVLHNAVRTPATHAKPIAIHWSVPPVIGACQRLDDFGKLGLQHFDALSDDGVRFEVANGFDVEVEFRGSCGVIEGLVRGGRVFEIGIFRFGPIVVAICQLCWKSKRRSFSQSYSLPDSTTL